MGAGAGFGLGMMVPQAMTNSIASGTSSSNGTNNEGSSLEDKLKTLNNLKENGLITEQEFLDKREKILSTL